MTDIDVIEKSNLARCVLFREGDDGKSKSATAAERVMKLNSDIELASMILLVPIGQITDDSP
jgi:adenylyltransferase/sulfurtransferase